MKQNKDISYSCVICGRETNTLHEIFYGSANRKISIKYHLQVPLCNICHACAHADKRRYRKVFCEKHHIENERLDKITERCKLIEDERLGKIAERCKLNLELWKI